MEGQNIIDRIRDASPSLDEIVDKLGSAGLARVADEIMRPIGDRAESNAMKSPDGRLGRLGTVGVAVGLDPKTLVILAAVAVGVVYLATRKG